MTIRHFQTLVCFFAFMPFIGLAQTAPDVSSTLPESPTLHAPDLDAPQTEIDLPDATGSAPETTETPDALNEADSTVTTSAPEIGTENAAPDVTTNDIQELNADLNTREETELGEVVLSDQSPTEGADAASPSVPVEQEPAVVVLSASERAMEFLENGGPALWAIAALSVITLALIFWKIWRLALAGAWAHGQAARAVEVFEFQGPGPALELVENRRGIRSQVMATTLQCLKTMSVDVAREETARVAKRRLGEARIGLGALELISTVAPLLGLLGTVLGMIAAFQALQAAGARADPTLLAGGIWEALLTTAAGMAVAIPASAALTWFESVIERMRQDIEDNATRLFVSTQSDRTALAAQ